MTKKEKIIKRAKELLSTLNFEQCIELFDRLPVGNPMCDLVMDRMEELDKKRFEVWL